MERLIDLLPIAAFIALAAGLVVVFRRSGSIARRSHEVGAFKAAVADLAARIEISLEGATARIDAVRRQQVPADTISPTIEAANDALERYLVEMRALRGPKPAAIIRDRLVGDLERATRALGMVEHGASIQAQVHRRSRELEAQTSLKRGYLNLMHAREAIARHALEASELSVGVEADARTAPEVRAASAGPAGPPPTPPAAPTATPPPPSHGSPS